MNAKDQKISRICRNCAKPIDFAICGIEVGEVVAYECCRNGHATGNKIEANKTPEARTSAELMTEIKVLAKRLDELAGLL